MRIGPYGRYLLPRFAAVCAVAIAAVFFVHPCEATTDAVRHATSQRPQWEVGTIDPGLSRACRQQRFNQIADHQRYISYRGEQGSGVTGIAKQGWNLRDPDRRAEPEATYHFADDGLSTCRVYVAKEKKPAGP